MNKFILGGLAFVFVAGGVLLLVTGAVIYKRNYEQEARSQNLSGEVLPENKDRQSANSPGADQEWLTEYTLINTQGKAVDSKDLKGQVHVVNFFFASCPSECRLMNNQVEKLQREYGPQGVKFVSITCDPQHDTPETLRNYARLFDAPPDQWMFLTSNDLTYISRIGAEVYESHVAEKSHTKRLVLVDQQGKVAGKYIWDDPKEIQEMKQAMEKLLAK